MRENLVFRGIARAWLLWACESEYITLTRTHSHIHTQTTLTHTHTHTEQTPIWARERSSPSTNTNEPESPACDVMLAQLPMCTKPSPCPCVWVSVSESFGTSKMVCWRRQALWSPTRWHVVFIYRSTHRECYILCENFALEIIIVSRTDAKIKDKMRGKCLRCVCAACVCVVMCCVGNT